MLNAVISTALVCAFVVYLAIAIASWAEDNEPCPHCRVLKSLAWPYTMYKEWRD